MEETALEMEPRRKPEEVDPTVAAEAEGDEGDAEKGVNVVSQQDRTAEDTTKEGEERHHETGLKLVTICISLALALFCTALDNTSKTAPWKLK